MKRLIASLLLVLFTFSSTACIGRMAVSGKVRSFNLDVAESKYARELVFLVLHVIPVYPFAGMIDLLIVNSIEFWSGTNPVNGEDRLALIGDQRYVSAEDGSAAISTLREDGSLDLELRAADGSPHFVNLVREDGQIVARDEQGRSIARMDSKTGLVESMGASDSAF